MALFFYVSATMKVVVGSKSAKQKMLKKHLTITFSRLGKIPLFSSRPMDGPPSFGRLYPQWDRRNLNSRISWPCQWVWLKAISKSNALISPVLLSFEKNMGLLKHLLTFYMSKITISLLRKLLLTGFVLSN